MSNLKPSAHGLLACVSASEKTKEDEEEKKISAALAILERRMRCSDVLSSPNAVRHWLCLRFAGLEREAFGVLFLDSQHRVIAFETPFFGTLTQCSVYPREIVKAALGHNAAAAIFAHNHPSGVAEPSQADELLTRQLQGALALVDVKVIDHFVVAGPQAVSFAQRGLL